MIPLVPMGMAFFILILLVSFNRTINRLTKPISFLLVFSLLISALISFYLYLAQIEGEVYLSKYLWFIEDKNLILHLNSLTEKVSIFFNLIIALVIGVLFYKLPRQKGYNALLIGIGFISSSIIFAVMLLDFSLLI